MSLSFCLQLAIMSGHFELGEIIKNHKDSDVGKLLHCAVSPAGHVCCLPTSSLHVCWFLLKMISLMADGTSSSPKSTLSPFALPPSVFFLESPKYVPRRKESSHTLPLPPQHSHPLLRANSENTVSQSDAPVLPSKAATNPNPRQVPRTDGRIDTEYLDRP